MRAWKVGEFNETVLPRPSWVVDGLIPGAGWTLIVAPAKTGKSVFAEQMAYALARGETFLYWPVARPWRVTFVEGDAPDSDLQDQTKAIMREPTENLDIIIPDSKSLLVDKVEAPMVARRIKDHDAEYVIFDALEPLAGPLLDINTQHGIQTAINTLKLIAGGRPFLLIHHPRKERPDADNVEDIRNAAAGHHFLTSNSSAALSLRAVGAKRGTLATIGRRGAAKDHELERLQITPTVAIWVTVAETKKTPGRGSVQAPPDGRSLGSLFDRPVN